MPRQEIPIPLSGKPNPKQVFAINTVDDRREIHILLKQLPPMRRLRFLEWVCAIATMPNSRVPLQPASSMYRLAEEARHDDTANERLSWAAFYDVVFMAMELCLDLPKVLAELQEWVRRPGEVTDRCR